jgi:hypothetical protein
MRVLFICRSRDSWLQDRALRSSLSYATSLPTILASLSMACVSSRNQTEGEGSNRSTRLDCSTSRGRTTGKHPEFVFTFRSNPTRSILNSGWKRVRIRAGLPNVRVHDYLRHTFGHRIRAAAVSFEDRQDLLGHKSERMTTHYAARDVSRLIEAAEKVCKRRPNTVLRISHTNLTQSASPAKTVRRTAGK